MPNIPHSLSTFVPTRFDASLDVVQVDELVLESLLDVISFLGKREDSLFINVDILCIEYDELCLDGRASLSTCFDLGCEIGFSHIGSSETLASFHPVLLCSV